MNKIQTIPGADVFASVTSAPEQDAPQDGSSGQLTGTTTGVQAIDGDEGRGGSLLSRIHSAGPQYRRSLFRR